MRKMTSVENMVFVDLFDIVEEIPCQRSLTSYIEVTINLPQTKEYLKLNRQQMIDRYIKIFETSATYLFVTERYHVIEYYKSGLPHLHGFFKFDGRKCIEGLVADVARCIHVQLPKRYSIYKEQFYYHKFQRYVVPPMTLQYTDGEDMKRQHIWIDYLHKDQPK